MGVQLSLKAKAHQWIDEYDRLEKAFINATKTRSQHESAAHAKARRDHDAHLSAQTLSDPKANQVEVPLGTGVRKLFFPSGFIRKIWTFWTWDRTYFTALLNGAIIMLVDPVDLAVCRLLPCKRMQGTMSADDEVRIKCVVMRNCGDTTLLTCSSSSWDIFLQICFYAHMICL
jgi:hypothetical protein